MSSAGPSGGFIACAFEGAPRTLSLSQRASQNVPETDAPPPNVGQQVIDAVLAKHGVEPSLQLRCDCSDAELQDPRWRIPLATRALVALRDHVSGLAEVLFLEDILDTLQDTGIINKHRDTHRVHAALYGGIHAQISRDGQTMNFHTPEAAIIWIQIPYDMPKSAWTHAQKDTVSYKRHAGASERITQNMLRALCGDEFAIFDAFEALQPPQALLSAIPGWIPARNTVKSRDSQTILALEGRGPDMLIVHSTEDEAMSAALLATQRLEAHSFHATVHAWSTLRENNT